MWHKQLTMYPLNGKLPTKEELQEALSEATFSHCQGLDWFSEGFAPPVSFDEGLVFASQGSLRIALKKEEKVLPSTVIKDFLDDKITAIEQEEARQVGRKEKQALKEQITDDLLPRAFVKSSQTQAIFDLNRKILLINNASPTKAEAMLSKMRQALGGLEAPFLRTEKEPSSMMTDWLLGGEAEGSFVLDSDCELKGTGDLAPTVRISKQDLTAEEVSNHIKNGKTVTQLGLIWNERVRFVLTSDLTLKRIQFLDVLQEEASQQGDDMPSLVQASQIIMCDSLGELMAELINLLGGYREKSELIPEKKAYQTSTSFDDELYGEAVKFVLDGGKPSISSIQRHLRIGYNRAACLIEQMEIQSVVGVMDPKTGDRKVLMELTKKQKT